MSRRPEEPRGARKGLQKAASGDPQAREALFADGSGWLSRWEFAQGSLGL